jgi:hypothetical protein
MQLLQQRLELSTGLEILQLNSVEDALTVQALQLRGGKGGRKGGREGEEGETIVLDTNSSTSKHIITVALTK